MTDTALLGAVHAEFATFLALVIFTLISLGLGVVANLVASRKAGFLQKYFLGNRSLGAFAVALTAAVMSLVVAAIAGVVETVGVPGSSTL